MHVLMRHLSLATALEWPMQWNLAQLLLALGISWLRPEQRKAFVGNGVHPSGPLAARLKCAKCS